MSQEKENEIRIQFLEEAEEYLDTIETTLLGIASKSIDAQEMDAVLRGAHSVKGGAGMMGYTTLSQLAHRMEDSFKVLKVQKKSISFDAQLESLLLTGVDRLRQVLVLNRQGTDVDEDWLLNEGNPVFDALHARLGHPTDEDATSMLGAEEGTNVAALLFETEVEGCLARLESVLADPEAPCLSEEVSIMAQELGGLGEMLQLDAFTSLCESILAHLEAAPFQVKEIAQKALFCWRRSQALVLVGQVNSLPSAIDFVSPGVAQLSDTELISDEGLWSFQDGAISETSRVVAESDIPWPIEEWAASFSDIPSSAEVDISTELMGDSFDIPEQVVADVSRELVGDSFADFIINTDIISPESLAESLGNSDLHLAEVSVELIENSGDIPDIEIPEVSTDIKVISTERARDGKADSVPQNTGDFLWQEPATKSSSQVGVSKEGGENTVRVSVRQLEQLNDLFGELTISRNGMGLQMSRLRNLIETLSRRVGYLEQANIRLRTSYDTVATQDKSLFNNNKNNHDNYNKFIRDKSDQVHPSSLTLHPSFDALEMDQYSDLHLLSMEVMETIVQIQEVTSDVELSLEDTDTTARELNQTAKQMQTHLTRIQMRPLSDLVGRYQRALRDLCREYGKEVELKVSGKGTLIDRSILEALSDPLMHLVRNAFDHGIELPHLRQQSGKSPRGLIEIKAAHRGNQTMITISDDGNGINLDKIRARALAMGLDGELLAAASEDDLLSLIFEAGFSTAQEVTALSGRGVGMDVVRNNLKEIRGDIRVDTTAGKGTTFTLTVPFTLSVARILLVESNSMLLAFPTDAIEEMVLLASEEVFAISGGEVLKWFGEMIPLIRLGDWLTFNCPRKVVMPEGVPSIPASTVLMISQGERLVALQVDRCWGEQEVAVRQVNGPFSLPEGMSSCTILGDGKVVPMVDPNSLLRWIDSFRDVGKVSGERFSALHPFGDLSLIDSLSNQPPGGFVVPIIEKETILVVDDSINVRRFLALALEKAGYLVEQAKDGQDAVEKLLGGLSVNAVICDIEMPRLDGYGFLARIKSEPGFSDLPVAMLTSRSGDKHRQLAMTLGASAYFPKPYNERDLLATLRGLIQGDLSG
ncbi:response regulator [Limnofasciculus baicalensis]|uniref:histidine kinase n=1 Tax=Limnofasciculus baicalensis BBK-W-15 TaxID=2699891 RepID=A0AAE3KQ97_9CYAN|nr:response regulator [Limnofasciculus baicalensis BBK-W-15]